jgi:hypothetical protein
MTTFDEYVSSFNDTSFIDYLRQYYEFGLRSKELDKDPDGVFDAFGVIHAAGELEAMIAAMGVYPDRNNDEYELELDPFVYEIFSEDFVDEMVETTFEAATLLSNLSNKILFLREIYVGKLLGAFILGLGYDPGPYRQSRIEFQLSNMNNNHVWPN